MFLERTPRLILFFAVRATVSNQLINELGTFISTGNIEKFRTNANLTNSIKSHLVYTIRYPKWDKKWLILTPRGSE